MKESQKKLNTLHSKDVDEIPNIIKPLGWEVEYRQLERGQFKGLLEMVPIGQIEVVHGKYNLSLHHKIQSPKDLFIFAIPLNTKPAAIRFQGAEVKQHQSLCIANHQEVDILSGDFHNLAVIHIPIDLLKRNLKIQYGVDLPLAIPENGLLTSDVESFRTVQQFFKHLFTHYRKPQQHAHPFWQEDDAVKEDRILSIILKLMMKVNESTEAAPYKTAQPQKIARRIMDYMDGHLDQAIRMEDLCRVSGTSIRTIEYAFQNTVGTSPITYLRKRRLQEAHRLLRSDDYKDESITSIAMATNNMHLGKFSVSYKELFDESPSETRAKT